MPLKSRSWLHSCIEHRAFDVREVTWDCVHCAYCWCHLESRNGPMCVSAIDRYRETTWEFLLWNLHKSSGRIVCWLGAHFWFLWKCRVWLMQICSAHHWAHEWPHHLQNSIARTYYALHIFPSVWKWITQFRVHSMRTPTITFLGASKCIGKSISPSHCSAVSLACEMTNAKEMPFSQLNDRMPISIVIVLTYCDDGLFGSKNINSPHPVEISLSMDLPLHESLWGNTPQNRSAVYHLFDRVFLLFIVRFPLFRFRFSCGAYPVPLPTDFNAFFLHKTHTHTHTSHTRFGLIDF